MVEADDAFIVAILARRRAAPSSCRRRRRHHLPRPDPVLARVHKRRRTCRSTEPEPMGGTALGSGSGGNGGSSVGSDTDGGQKRVRSYEGDSDGETTQPGDDASLPPSHESHDSDVDSCCASEWMRSPVASQRPLGDARDAFRHEWRVVEGVDCIGCLLPPRALRAVDAFVQAHAACLPEPELWAQAARVYEERVRQPRLRAGLEVPAWTAEQIDAHYAHGVHPLLEAVRVCRELRALRQLLARRLAHGQVAGEARLYRRLVRAESKQATILSALGAAVRLRNRPRRSAAAARSPRPGRSLSSREQRREEASPDRWAANGPMDEGVARQALRDYLSAHLRPCRPLRTCGVQPTLVDVVQGVDPSEVTRRNRAHQLAQFQAAKPPRGRRCYCAHRFGGACHITIDRAFVAGFADASPRAAAFFTAEDALVGMVLELLQLDPQSVQRQHRGYRRNAIFGWRWAD